MNNYGSRANFILADEEISIELVKVEKYLEKWIDVKKCLPIRGIPVEAIDQDGRVFYANIPVHASRFVEIERKKRIKWGMPQFTPLFSIVKGWRFIQDSFVSGRNW